MDFGFFVKIRCFLRVDHVILKCAETRYYHEFDKKYILRETRLYQDSYDAFISVSLTGIELIVEMSAN